ncbi:MAG: hypothetical protein GDA38_24450 [Hormoscilla sp. SP12CHS1]|nr:hypothetical protein [Hormoscilla sp. SP12CHS1]
MPEPSSTIAQTQPLVPTAPPGNAASSSLILLSLTLPTVLFGLAWAHTLGETIGSLGLASEEIFRGVSLPLLTGGQPGTFQAGAVGTRITINNQPLPRAQCDR